MGAASETPAARKLAFLTIQTIFIKVIRAPLASARIAGRLTETRRSAPLERWDRGLPAARLGSVLVWVGYAHRPWAPVHMLGVVRLEDGRGKLSRRRAAGSDSDVRLRRRSASLSASAAATAAAASSRSAAQAAAGRCAGSELHHSPSQSATSLAMQLSPPPLRLLRLLERVKSQLLR